MDHPVLPRPWEYEIMEVQFVTGPNRAIEVVFSRGELRKKLCFSQPQGVRFVEGALGPNGGLAMSDLRIYDVSADGLEGLRVRVCNDGSSLGVLEFWAADVVALS